MFGQVESAGCMVCSSYSVCSLCMCSKPSARLPGKFSPVAADLGLAAPLQGKTTPCVCSHDVNIGRKMISIIER